MINLAAILPAARAPFEVHEVETYTPGPDEFLLRNEMIGFNGIESKIAKSAAVPVEYPAIIGSTFGGTIISTGSAVTRFNAGDRVVVSKAFGVKGNQYGAFQRYVLVKDIMVSKIPDSIDLAIPASLMMNLTCVVGLFTGHLGLNKPSLSGSVPPPEKNKKTHIFVYGGSSSFGSLAVQYLSQAGYTVITTSSPAQNAFVSTLGAEAVLDHYTVPSTKLITQLVALGPFAHIIDMISSPASLSITGAVVATQGGGKLYATQPAFGEETLPHGVQRVFEPWSNRLYEESKRDLQRWCVDEYLPRGLREGCIKAMGVEKIEGGLGGVDGAMGRLSRGGGRLVCDPWV